MSRYLKWIAHRGNFQGPNPKENHPDYLWAALRKGYYVEMDVWWVEKDGEEGKFMLGHDRPTYLLPLDLLKHARVYAHCKNAQAAAKLFRDYPQVHCFGHDKDEFVLTNRGEVWTYPGKELTPESICVMPEWQDEKWKQTFQLHKCLGVCSDYLRNFSVPSYLFGKCVAVHTDVSELFEDLLEDSHTVFLPDTTGELAFLDGENLVQRFYQWERHSRESLTRYDYLILNKPISEKFHLKMFSHFEGEKPEVLRNLYRASQTVVPNQKYLVYHVREQILEEVQV
jgi:hypothetical protein